MSPFEIGIVFAERSLLGSVITPLRKSTTFKGLSSAGVENVSHGAGTTSIFDTSHLVFARQG